MKIKDILAAGSPTLSFEVFPPKGEEAYESVEKGIRKCVPAKKAHLVEGNLRAIKLGMEQ